MKFKDLEKATGVPFKGETTAGKKLYVERFQYVLEYTPAKKWSPYTMYQKPTSRQLDFVKNIEIITGKKFTAKTRYAAAAYIETYGGATISITQKQLNAIKICEKHLAVKFTGTTRKEAHDFLRLYLDDAIKQMEIVEDRNERYGE